MIIGIDASRAFSPLTGGPENYSYYLIRAMLQVNSPHKFRLYLRSDSSKSPRYDAFFRNLPTTNYQLQTIPWFYLWTQMGLALECLVNPPDVLFVPAHTLPIIAYPWLKTVVTIHDLGAQFLPNYHKFPQKYYLNFATRYAVRHATKIIAVSRYTQNDLVEKLEANSAKIAVVYEGYDRELFYPRSEEEIGKVKAKYGIEGDYFLFVGTIQPRKNLVRLIEAFSWLILKSGPSTDRKIGSNPITQGSAAQGLDPIFQNSNLTLILAGAPGWLYDEIYEAPEKFGVGDRVKFPGKVPDEDLPALMSGCKAFVFPSLYEGFGLSLLEALACGVVTITSKTTSLPEVGGEAPFYVDPDNVEEIAQTLGGVQKLTSQESGRINNKSLNQARKFSWQESAHQTLSLIESM